MSSHRWSSNCMQNSLNRRLLGAISLTHLQHTTSPSTNHVFDLVACANTMYSAVIRDLQDGQAFWRIPWASAPLDRCAARKGLSWPYTCRAELPKIRSKAEWDYTQHLRNNRCNRRRGRFECPGSTSRAISKTLIERHWTSSFFRTVPLKYY